MGSIIISNDSVAPWNSKVVPPVARGLEGWFTFDTDSGRFGRNRAKGKADAEVVGSPIAYATHGRFKGLTNYLVTQIADSDEITLMVVGKTVASPTGNEDGALLVGGYVGASQTSGITGAAGGGNIFLNSATTISGSATRNNGSGAATAGTVSLLGTAPTAWAIRAMRAKTGDVTKVFDLTAGVSAVGASVTQRALSNTRYRIGGATSLFAGESDISVVAIFSAALTDEEIAKNAVLMRNRMARLGISV